MLSLGLTLAINHALASNNTGWTLVSSYVTPYASLISLGGGTWNNFSGSTVTHTMSGTAVYPTTIEGSMDETVPWSAKFTPLDSESSETSWSNTKEIPANHSHIVDVWFDGEDGSENWRPSLGLFVSLKPSLVLSGSIQSRTRDWAWYSHTSGSVLPIPPQSNVR